VNYAVGSAIAGRLSELKARGDMAGIKKAVGDGARWTFWPSLAGAAALLVVGKPLLAIFGSEFTVGYPLMFVLAAGLVARSVVGPAEFVLRMLGEQKICAVVSGITAIVDLGLSFSLAPHYGTMGVAVANAASLTLMAALFYLFARQRLGFDISAFSGTT
jgi:O-antigen/teichoic acid export membrane protein